MTRQIVLFASTNKGKFEEFRQLVGLDPSLFKVISLDDLGYAVPACKETGTTFEENAELKVRHTQSYLKPFHKDAIVIGDDSGMSIRALHGRPGVYTRRWVGREMTDQEIISHCLELLKGCSDRTADYVTVLAVGFPNEPLRIIKGCTRGAILDLPRQDSYVEGVPFRSLFYIPEAGMMFHDVRGMSASRRENLHIGHEDALEECRISIKKYVTSPATLQQISDAFQKVWTKDTSYSPKKWSEDKPSVGQCAVSSLIVQDLLGG